MGTGYKTSCCSSWGSRSAFLLPRHHSFPWRALGAAGAAGVSPAGRAHAEAEGMMEEGGCRLEELFPRRIPPPEGQHWAWADRGLPL